MEKVDIFYMVKTYATSLCNLWPIRLNTTHTSYIVTCQMLDNLSGFVLPAWQEKNPEDTVGGLGFTNLLQVC